MPQVGFAIGAALFQAGVVATIGAATVVAGIINTAITIGISLAVSTLLAPKPPTAPKPSDIKQTLKQATAARLRHYGTVLVGGSRVFYDSTDKYRYSIIVTGHGELDGLIEHRFDNNPCVIGNDDYVISSGSGQWRLFNLPRALVYFRTGEDDQTHFAAIQNDFPEWTNDHRLNGLSCVFLRFRDASSKHFTRIYTSNTEPVYTMLARGAKLYDPRDGTHNINHKHTWEWSDNAALVIADYLMHPDGYPGIVADDIDWQSVSVAADICDEIVTDTKGDNVRRYRISGSYSLEAYPADIVSNMVAACDGKVYQTAAGKIAIRVGAWEDPTVSLTDDQIISCEAKKGASGIDYVNEVRIVYNDPLQDYTETEAAPFQDIEDIHQQGATYSKKQEIYYIPHHNQASRIAKRLLLRATAEWNLSITTNLAGLSAFGERFITISIADLHISDQPFEVISASFDTAGMTVSLEVISVSETDFDFDAANEEGTPPTALANTAYQASIPQAVSPTPITDGSAVIGINGTVLVADLGAPPFDSYVYEAEYRRNMLYSQWLPMVINNTNYYGYSITNVDEGSQYLVRSRLISSGGTAGDWSQEVTATAIASGNAASDVDITDETSTPYFYYGYDSSSGGWLIKRKTRSGSTFMNADISGNASYADLNTAWPDRAILTYS